MLVLVYSVYIIYTITWPLISLPSPNSSRYGIITIIGHQIYIYIYICTVDHQISTLYSSSMALGGITIKTREKNTQYSTCTVLSVLVLNVYDPPSKKYNLSK